MAHDLLLDRLLKIYAPPKQITTNIINDVCNNCSASDFCESGGVIKCTACGDIFRLHVDPPALHGEVDEDFPDASPGIFIENKGSCMWLIRSNMYMPKNHMDTIKRHAFTLISIKLEGERRDLVECAKSMYSNYLISPSYKSAHDDNIRGRIAGIVYYTYKKYGIHKKYRELAKTFDINTSDVTNGVNHIFDALFYGKQTPHTPEANVGDFIAKYVKLLGQSAKLQQDAIDVAVLISSSHHIPCMPSSIAAGCIYYSCAIIDNGLQAHQITKFCGVTTVTIMKVYKMIIDIVN
jgi:hypothetical protein